MLQQKENAFQKNLLVENQNQANQLKQISKERIELEQDILQQKRILVLF